MPEAMPIKLRVQKVLTDVKGLKPSQAEGVSTFICDEPHSPNRSLIDLGHTRNAASKLLQKAVGSKLCHNAVHGGTHYRLIVAANLRLDSATLIGKGTFGAVWKCTVADTKEMVAIKKVLLDDQYQARSPDVKTMNFASLWSY